MREIKFKFWDPDKREMSRAYSLDEIINDGIRMDLFSGDIPLEYTGVKDLEGREIYEGDIVLRMPLVSPGFENWVSPHTGLVEFYEDKFLIARHPNSHEFDCRYPLKKSKVKVIGNIYENPELIQ